MDQEAKYWRDKWNDAQDLIWVLENALADREPAERGKRAVRARTKGRRAS